MVKLVRVDILTEDARYQLTSGGNWYTSKSKRVGIGETEYYWEPISKINVPENVQNTGRKAFENV